MQGWAAPTPELTRLLGAGAGAERETTMGVGADAKAVEIAGSKPALDLSRSVYILSFRLIEVIQKIVDSVGYVYSSLALAC